MCVVKMATLASTVLTVKRSSSANLHPVSAALPRGSNCVATFVTLLHHCGPVSSNHDYDHFIAPENQNLVPAHQSDIRVTQQT